MGGEQAARLFGYANVYQSVHRQTSRRRAVRNGRAGLRLYLNA